MSGLGEKHSEKRGLNASELQKEAKALYDEFNRELSRLLAGNTHVGNEQVQRIKDGFFLASCALNSIEPSMIIDHSQK